jgi:hypothetical protein
MLPHERLDTGFLLPERWPRSQYLRSDDNKTEIRDLKDHMECVERAYFMGEAPEHEGFWFYCVPPAVS